MIAPVTEARRQKCRMLLTKTKLELYAFYIENIASPYVLGKTERGRKTCFGMWLSDLKGHAKEPQK